MKPLALTFQKGLDIWDTSICFVVRMTSLWYGVTDANLVPAEYTHQGEWV